MPQLEHLVLHSDERRYATPLLLIHGAWHGAWCWHDASLLVFPAPQCNRSPVLAIAAECDTIFTLDEQRALARA
jgi:hypothetical protein